MEDVNYDVQQLPYGGNLVKIVLYYAVDWIAMGALFLAMKLMEMQSPSERYFQENDPSFSYPRKADTIPMQLLYMIGIGLPLLCSAFMQILMVKLNGNKWNWTLDFHHFALGLLESMAISESCTTFLKRFCGRIRPSGFQRLAMGDPTYNMSYVSGHTSLSFQGMTFLGLYLCGKAGVFSKAGLFWSSQNSSDPYRGSFAISIASLLLPLFICTFVGATRLTDYAHHFSDVNGGAIVGIVSGSIAYFVNFSSPLSSFSHLCRPLERIQFEKRNVLRNEAAEVLL